jgi:hypothetical protein
MGENEENDGPVGLGQLVEHTAQLLELELGHLAIEGADEPVIQVAGEERIGQLSQIELEHIGGQVGTLQAQVMQSLIRILTKIGLLI